MIGLLLKLLNVPMDDAGRIAGASIAFRGGLTPGWFVFLAIVAVVLVYWLYRLSPVTVALGRRFLLTGLRALFLVLLLGLLLRPVLAFTVEGSIRRVLVMLFDGSASMQIRDPRLEVDDQKRAALAKDVLDPARGLNQALDRGRARDLEQVARIDLVRAVFQNERLKLLPRLDQEFELAAYSFGQGTAELAARKAAGGTNQGGGSATAMATAPGTARPGGRRPLASVDQFDWVERLAASAPVTAGGDAIRDVLSRKRGQPLAGIVMVTDGVNNSGSQPRDAALLARQEGVPLYLYGVGITSPRDIILQNLFGPEVTFVKDEVPITVRLRGQGLAGESAEVQLRLGDEVVARKTVVFSGESEQVVAMKFTPSMLGEFDLTASVEARPDEAVKDNNSRTQRLKVIDARIRVLLVDQSPRWEFRYLQAMLLRDRRVDLKCYLVEGDKAIARAQDSPYLAEIPSRRDELFKYDLVILGDVDPKVLTAQHQENLNKLVAEFGGGLLVLAGKRSMPASYRRTPLEKMLPVEFDALTLESKQDPVAEVPVKLALTAAGRGSVMMRISDREDENARLWGSLPPVYWVAKVARAKPAAEVLVVDPDPAKETRFGKMPVIALQQYGLGQVMYVGTDNTWRWRKNAGDFYYTLIWGQISQRLSIQRLLGVSKKTQLSLDKQSYYTGDRVTVYARLYTGVGFDPVQEPSVAASFSPKAGGPRSEVTLRGVPDQPGMFRGEFIAPPAGAYGFSVESDPQTVLDLLVAEPKFEFGETAMNEPLLKELAATTGGQYFREEDLHRLPEAIRARTERVQSPLEVELWASPLYFLIVIAVVTAEWIVRKMSHLK